MRLDAQNRFELWNLRVLISQNCSEHNDIPCLPQSLRTDSLRIRESCDPYVAANQAQLQRVLSQNERAAQNTTPHSDDKD